MKIGLDMLQGYGAAAAQFFFVPFRRPHPPQGKKLDLARFQLTFEDSLKETCLIQPNGNRTARMSGAAATGMDHRRLCETES